MINDQRNLYVFYHCFYGFGQTIEMNPNTNEHRTYESNAIYKNISKLISAKRDDEKQSLMTSIIVQWPVKAHPLL